MALNDLNLSKMTVARCVGTGCFLIRYCKGHVKLTYRLLKKFSDYNR